MKLEDYEKYYHNESEFIIPRDEFEKIIEENQRLKENNQAMQEEMARTWKKYDEVNNVLNELRWKPIEEYNRKKYDWVLVKYHLEDNYEYIPCVAEMRYDGFWYDRDDNIIDYDVDYFFDMQILDELKESDK